ncbi:hypothetical protein R1flu_021657 [Riccia fluitans]|uniref:Uncharacterized protein n=1 Tax=Riccia fluitans TaxID=41844 RepID=A0ABD1ZT17_9MARC
MLRPTLWPLLSVAALIVAVFIAYMQWIYSQTIVVSHVSGNPVPLSATWHCSCALPDYLKGIDDKAGYDPFKVKSCYQFKSAEVESVLVVSFSNSSVQELLELVNTSDDDDDNDDEPGRSSGRVLYRTLHISYLVTNKL